MPTTSSGDTVYAEPAVMEEYVQTKQSTFSLSTTADPDGDGASEWREFLEKIQVRMKARIDEYVGQDFEDHAGDTVVLNGGTSASRILALPDPVRAVSAVRVDGEVLDASLYRWTESGQLIRLDEGSTRKQWPTGYGNIEVDLDWGHTSPPADVVEAELKLVAHSMAGLAQLREGMVVQTDDVDLQVALPEAMTTEVKNILRHHRSGGRTAGVI